MPTPVLATKLYAPPRRVAFVPRPRLIERLNAGLGENGGHGRKLSLISAPAGFGKTSLLSEWISTGQRPVAWLSLDEGDDNLARFLAYVVAALRTLAPAIGEQLLDALQSPPHPPTDALLTPLINEIAAIQADFILVLDDYHVLESPAIDDALTFLIDHLPPPLHLVITTREDPNLPIARLRARGQLTELRAADLRFTPAEAAEFLNRVMGLALSADEVAILENRTEGWIAGLQLAALSIQGRPDIPGFIRSFAGEHRYIVDYLVEEVLNHQPEPVRNFLMQTAILDRLTGSLCDAVTGQAGGGQRLEALQRGNFFVVPLDDHRQWYRYHHLFAEVLRAYLLAEQPDQVGGLHRRASEWYERQGSTAEAIGHALAAQAFARAADLIEQVFRDMSRSRQEATLLGWLRALPEALLRQRPVLCNLFAGVLLQINELEGVETWLSAAERWLAPPAGPPTPPDSRPAEMVVVNEAEFRRLPGAVAIHRAGQALMLGRVGDTIQHARRALELAPADDTLGRGGATILLGLCFWTNGDLEAARRQYADGIPLLQRAGNISDAIGSALALADIHITQGHLREAMQIYQDALRLTAARGTPTMRGTADMLVGMSELSREQNDLQAAVRYLERSQAQGEHTGLPQSRYRWYAALAGIRQAEGDLNGALDLLDEAERLYLGDFSPNVRPIAARKARLWADLGRLDQCLDWARARGLSAADELSYLREYEHVTLARVKLAQHRRGHADGAIDEAVGLLEALLRAAEQGGRAGSIIEILILQALAFQAMAPSGVDAPPAALASLERALRLAEPEGYVRLFVDEGLPLARLLDEAAKRELLPAYAANLLRAFPAEQLTGVSDGSLPPRVVPAKPTPGALVEPLSERELDVLRLFGTELSGPEIADELVIALSTLRSHTKSIYSKLNVNSRRAAVNRAAELGLL